MNCMDDEMIQKYMDGELTPAESEYFENHIELCKNCAEKTAYYKERKTKLLDAINLLAAPVTDLPERITLPNASKKKKVWITRLVPLMAAASVALFVIFLIQKNEALNGTLILHEPSFVWETDANKTVLEQELIITVISPDGRISEQIVE